MLRIFESPEIDVPHRPSSENPTGVGAGVPPVAPALANAIFGGHWQTHSQLPFVASDLAKEGAKINDCIHGDEKHRALEKRTGHNSRARKSSGLARLRPCSFFMDSSCCQARRKCLSRRFPADLSCLNLAALPRIVIPQAMHLFRETTVMCIFRT